MHRSADSDPRFGHQDAGNSKHLCTIGLHQEVGQTAGIDLASHLDLSTKDRPQLFVQKSVVDTAIGPMPKGLEGLPMLAQ